jgi:hypothetical protein
MLYLMCVWGGGGGLQDSSLFTAEIPALFKNPSILSLLLLVEEILKYFLPV